MWYSYTATGNGTININSCASDPAGIDTRLWIYTDTCNTLTPIANNDDGCADDDVFVVDIVDGVLFVVVL